MSLIMLKTIMVCGNDSNEEALVLAHQQEEEELFKIYHKAYGSNSGETWWLNQGSIIQ